VVAMAIFDFENVFGEDYLYFYGPDLSPERNAREAEAIWQMLSLQPGQKLLDIGCGHGRIANQLAKRGAHVTGVDANSRFLDRARADAAAAGLEVEYVQGDVRSLPWRDRFDAALIWFTTFGYFDEADNERVLMQAAQALRPCGRLLIEQISRAALLRQGLPRSFVIERGDDLMIDLVNYDQWTDRTHTERITVRDGRVRRAVFSVRLYGLAEFARLLRAAGFRMTQAFGRNGEPLTLDSRRVIVVAEKSDQASPPQSA
jgi:SAM-dependent methyltransferase